MRRLQTVGLLLWRSGLLLAWSAGAVILVRSLLTTLPLPRGIAVGLALCGAGVVLVFGSLVWERVADLRREREGQREGQP